jgi:uncharacterized protein YutE (UPF0331/DUF86 family)
MDEKIVEQLKLLHKHLQYLDVLSRKSKDEFLKDVIMQGACERYLQLAIESSLNIGSRIIALEAGRSNISAPESYADIFLKLGELGILSQEFALNLMAMARIRNRLVHAYWDIDPEIIYGILRENRREIHEFKDKIIEYLKREN